jgi:uncharacterized protein YceK
MNLIVFRHMLNLSTIAITLIVAVLVGGCATLSSGDAAKEDASGPNLMQNRAIWEQRSRDRANERWTHIKEKRFEKAHAYFTAASSKGFTPEMLSINIQNLRASEGTVDRVECTEEKCEVWVNVSITIRIPRVGNKQQLVPLREDWVIEKNEFHLLRRQ